MLILRVPVPRGQLAALAAEQFDDMLKAAVDADSMLNVRPSQGNRSRGVDNESTRAGISAVGIRLVTDG